MTYKDKELHGVVVDTWMLEQTGALLSDGVLYDDIEDGLSDGQDKVSTLFHFLDLLVLQDLLVYDTSMASYWKEYGCFNSVESIFQGVTPVINDIDKPDPIAEDLSSSIAQSADTIFESMRRERALHYFYLAKDMGLQYWPSPQRQRYVDELFSGNGGTFNVLFKDLVDKNVLDILQEAINPLGSLGSISLPGFGSAVLAECQEYHEIVPIALEFRNTKQSKAFRYWSRDMDKAFQVGNIKEISIGLSGVRDLFEDLRKELRLPNKEKPKTKVRIGLSPSVTLEDSMSSFTQRVRTKRQYHMVFLKQHLNNVVESVDIALHVNRLFNRNDDSINGT